MEDWYSQEDHCHYKFIYNDPVKIIGGTFDGKYGVIISPKHISDHSSYLIETENDGDQMIEAIFLELL